jgi:hypothetical protein
MKRKYLQGKRGIEKPAFVLPQYIADTGIGKIRGAMEEKTAAKGAKGKARDKLQVKMGKMDIDYQVLHDGNECADAHPNHNHSIVSVRDCLLVLLLCARV